MTTRQEKDSFVPTEVFWKAVHWLKHDRPSILILLGPPGTGKSTIARQMIKMYPEYPSVFITPASGVDLEALLGTHVLLKGETRFIDGELKKALLRERTCIYVDDAHLVARATQRFNGLGDDSRKISTGEHQTFRVADGVKLALLVNPIPGDTPPWARTEQELPEQVRSRSRFLRLDRSGSLSPEVERAIALKHWPANYPTETLDRVLEVFLHLRTNGALHTYSPSLRDSVNFCQLIAQNVPPGSAYLETVAYKYMEDTELLAAKEAFKAKFNYDAETDASYGCSFAEGGGLIMPEKRDSNNE